MTNHSPGNAGLSDEAAGVSNDGAKSENADIAASAENGKRRALSCPLQPARLFNVLLTDHFSPITFNLPPDFLLLA
jgi:DNA-binding transcriptional regulator LsrR (DeoR family)